MPQQSQETLTRDDRKLSSFNSEARTVDVVLATETEVKRRSWETGLYLEVLVVSKASIDATRLDALPLLDQHDAFSGLSARLGSIVAGSLRIEGGKAVVTVKISRNAGGEALYRDLEDGHVLGASVGYRIESFEKTEAATTGGLPTIRATRWTPLELSIVSIPADPAATTRAHETEKETVMPQTIEDERQHEQPRQDTIRERTRLKELRGIARAAGIEDVALDSAIDSGISADTFRGRALETMVERQGRSETFPYGRMDETRHGGMTRNEAVADAMIHRVNPAHKPSDASREFVGLSCVEVARQTLESSGVSTRGMAAGQVIERALHTTGDFGKVISQVGQTTLQTAYASVPSPLKAAAKRTTAKDFKAKTAVRLGGFANLEKVNEHGEFKRGTVSESAESLKLETFGRIFGMTRQMLINDDLGAFANVAQLFGKKASDLEAKILVDLLKSNPKMGDNVALFHASHRNLGAAAALSADALSVARTSFRKQTDDTGELIGVGPRYLVVGAELETPAEKILTAIQANQTSQVNVFAGKLELVVEPRLTDPTAWYLAAPSEQVPGLEYAYLEGEEGPQFFENYGFNIDGVEIKVRLDFGAGFMDWRGWYRNAGA